MKKQVFVGVIGLVSCLASWAGVILDVHGTDQKKAELIIKEYGNDIRKLIEAARIGLETGNADNIDPKVKKQKALLQDQIKKQYGFVYLELQTTFYGNKKDLYTTIEVITKDKSSLLSYIDPPQPKETTSVSRKPIKKDLIYEMMEYDAIGFSLFMKHQLGSNSKCPVFHCTVGFEHPKLKPYLALFNQGAIKEKKLILNTLKNDPNPERRAAAVFLIGHFKDPNEILTVITPYIQDKSTAVRNNVMRVIGLTIDKAKIYDIDLKPILALLESPSSTDRNKALAVIFMATKSPANRNIILQLGGDNIVALLALKQLNNHDWAYYILRNLSGKDFGEHNIRAWHKWVSKERSHLV